MIEKEVSEKDDKSVDFFSGSEQCSNVNHEHLDDEQLEKKAKIAEFEKLQRRGDNRGLTKLIKSLTMETEEDMYMVKRQKNGQLRFGDVITINYQKEIFDKTDNKQHPVAA